MNNQTGPTTTERINPQVTFSKLEGHTDILLVKMTGNWNDNHFMEGFSAASELLKSPILVIDLSDELVGSVVKRFQLIQRLMQDHSQLFRSKDIRVVIPFDGFAKNVAELGISLLRLNGWNISMHRSMEEAIAHPQEL